MNPINDCPVCGDSQNFTFLKSRNFRINEEKFDVKECNNCSMRFTSPLPSEEEIGEYYHAENYVSHTGTKKGLTNKLFHFARYFTLRSKFNLVNKYAKGEKMLDIGAGNGVFLDFVKEKNWEVSGIELDTNSRERIEKNLGQKIATTVHENNESEHYDAITMWHVLEHVYNLKKDIPAIKSKLKKDGVFIVAVPNCDSYDAEFYKEYWAAYDLPIHLYHFRPKNVKDLFEQFDMEVIGMKPMKFDSFYIRLISEKYNKKQQGGLGVFIRGMWKGLTSNMKAKNGTYSSQIYILKNK